MPDGSRTIVVLNDTAAIAHYGCKVVMSRLVDSLAGAGYDVKTVSVYSTWKVHKKLINTAAAVIVNGEGTLHHSASRAQTLVAVAPYCHDRGIPVFLINSVWQENSDQMANQAGDFLLRYVRESRSQKQFAEQGLKATTVPDLTLGWNRTRSASGRSGRVYTDAVGMPATDLLWSLHREDPGSRYVTMTPPPGHRGDYPTKPFERLRPPFDETVFRTIRLRARHLFKRTLLVRGFAKNLWRRSLGDLERVPLEGFFEALEGAELVITGRFHGVVFCVLSPALRSLRSPPTATRSKACWQTQGYRIGLSVRKTSVPSSPTPLHGQKTMPRRRLRMCRRPSAGSGRCSERFSR